MPPERFDRDDVEHALDALASEVPTHTADAASLMARGRRRIMQRRLGVVAIAMAVLATAASVSALTSHDAARRVVAHIPKTTPSATGRSPSGIAVASSLEAWKCLNPLQYTDNGGLTWESIALPDQVPRDVSCTAVAGGYAWVTWPDSKGQLHMLRVRDAKPPHVLSLPQPPEVSGLGPLTFIDPDHGWFQSYVHESGKPVDLYRTLDGGATWKLAATNLKGGPIAFADADHGWSGDGQKLSETEDGGVTWRSVDLPQPAAPREKLALFQIRAHDNWVVVWRGSPISGARYHPFFDVSNDGGRTWSLRAGPADFELPDAGNNAFDAIDGRKWALTSGNSLRITNDSQQWQIRPDVPEVRYISSVAFPTPSVGWITSLSGTIFRTTDSGYSWADVTDGAAPASTTTTTPNAREASAPSQLAFASATEGWICGKQPLYTTNDFDYLTGGSKSVGIPANPSAVSGAYSQQPRCASAPGGNLWLVRGSLNDSESEIVRIKIRSDGTETSVIPFAPRPLGRIESLDFVDADHGWALVQRDGAGQHDLYTTGDGGVNWSLLLPDAPIIAPLEFTSVTSGWASSPENGNLKTTDDAGITWHSVNVPTKETRGNDTHVGLSFARGDVVVAQGGASTGNFEEPFFDVSTDSGRTWDLRPGPPVALQRTGPNGFGGADADHWALGYGNHLYTTNDGGHTWSDQEQFSGLATIYYVARPSATTMLASGYGDARQASTIVLGTTDGGDHWTTIDSSAPPDPNPAVAPMPGGIIGCPTRPLTPAPPTFEIAQAASTYAHLPRSAVSAVYRGNSTEGAFASVFRFAVASCGPHVLENIWVAYVSGPPNAGEGGSTARVTLALAHYADGWHVFGRYP